MSHPKPMTQRMDAPAPPAEARRIATGATAHALVERRVERDPSAIAVACGARRLSYGELNARANRLARELRSRGVGPESTVGILLERSSEWMVAILGVLKAGGAYVPLDPDHPSTRWRHIISDAGVRVLITRDADRIEPGVRASVDRLDLDADARRIGSRDAVDPAPLAAPGNLACVLYATGSVPLSTGVMVEHRNLVHSIRGRSKFYRERVEGFLTGFPFAFDGSIGAILWTLVHGGLVVLPLEGEGRNPAALADLIGRHRISHLAMPPRLHRAILKSSSPRRLRAVRVVTVRDEECLPGVVDDHRAVLPRAALFHEYGPMEATGWATVHRADPERTGGKVPIGRPIPPTRVYVLDSDGEPVAEGDPGEIHVAGPGVVRGYMNRPDLTEERFPEDPFREGRLYRTGDTARVRPDGAVELLGTPDPQVESRSGVAYEGPRDPAEAAVVEAWAETLPVARVGRGDNFFELGGDSILLVRTIACLRRRGLELSPADASRHPTAAEWAQTAALSVAAGPGPGAGRAPYGDAPKRPPRRAVS